MQPCRNLRSPCGARELFLLLILRHFQHIAGVERALNAIELIAILPVLTEHF